jgi:hypothetical protein
MKSYGQFTEEFTVEEKKIDERKIDQMLNSVPNKELKKIEKLAKTNKEKDQEKALEMLSGYIKDPDDAWDAFERIMSGK